MLFNPNSMNTEVLNQGHELLSAWLLYSRKSGGTASMADPQYGRPALVCHPAWDSGSRCPQTRVAERTVMCTVLLSDWTMVDEPDDRNLNQRAYIRCRDQDPSKLQNTVTVCRRRVLGDSPLLIMTQTRLEMPLCLIIKFFFSSQVEVFPLHSGSQAGRSCWYIFGTLPTGCTFKGPEVCE